MVFLASLVGESLSHSTEGEYSVDGFRTDTRCGWDCRITHSEFTNECGDSIFTKKRLVNFKAIMYGYRLTIRFLAFLTEFKACGI